MNNRNNFPIVLLVFLLAGFGCRKEIDLDSGRTFGVKELTESKNCQTNCQNPSDCEGKILQVAGILDEAGINRANNQFYIQDSKSKKHSLEAYVTEGQRDSLFNLIESRGGNSIKVAGMIHGKDTLIYLGCERVLVIAVSDWKDVRFP